VKWAWSEFTRALNCAKVIKLPSHSALATQIQFERRTKMDGDDVPASGNREETCWTVVPLASFLLLSLLLLCPRSALRLQQI
jgi:hypothetical protein